MEFVKLWLDLLTAPGEVFIIKKKKKNVRGLGRGLSLYTSDAADER